MMKISTVYPEYVFQRIGAGKNVDAVDFKKKAYIDLEGQTVQQVQFLIGRADTDKDVRFFQLDPDEE